MEPEKYCTTIVFGTFPDNRRPHIMHPYKPEAPIPDRQNKEVIKN